MSGHNKWSTIKHKKAKEDAKRGKVFTRLIRELAIAAREGGGDADGNPRLRTAMDAAKAANMPKDTMERAIKRGTGELEGVDYVENSYEGYGPGGVALYIECLTDNKNRTAAEVRHILSKHGGNLGQDGSVAWMFDRKGQLIIEQTKTDEDTIMEIALEAGAEDVKDEGEFWEILTAPEDFEAVKKAVVDAGIETEAAEVTRLPKDTKAVEGKEAEQLLKLLDLLEQNDDVQEVYGNHEVPDAVLEAWAGG